MTPWRVITGSWTPECLAIVDLIGWDPKGIPKRSTKMVSGIVYHKSDRKSCVLPTADRNNTGNLSFIDVYRYALIIDPTGTDNMVEPILLGNNEK